MKNTFGLSAIALVTLSLAACGGSSATAPASSQITSPTVSSAPASAPSTPAPVPASSAPARSSSSPASAASVSPQPSQSTAASAAAGSVASAGGVTLTLAPNAGKVDIKMKELLAGNAAQTEAVESTTAVSGTIMLDSKGGVLPGSKLTLDVTKLQSDRSIRDGFIKRTTLDTANYPMVEFVPKQVDGLGGPPPTSGQKTFKLIGDTTIKGVTKPMTWDVTAQFDQSGCKGVATSPFKLSDYGMTPPKAGPVIAVEDAGNLQVAFQAAAARAA